MSDRLKYAINKIDGGFDVQLKDNGMNSVAYVWGELLADHARVNGTRLESLQLQDLHISFLDKDSNIFVGASGTKWVPGDAHLRFTFDAPKGAERNEVPMAKKKAKKRAKRAKKFKAGKKSKTKRTSDVIHVCSKHGEFRGYTWGGHRRTCKAPEVNALGRPISKKAKKAKKEKVKRAKFEKQPSPKQVKFSGDWKSAQDFLGIKLKKVYGKPEFRIRSIERNGLMSGLGIEKGAELVMVAGITIAAKSDLVNMVDRIRNNSKDNFTIQFQNEGGKSSIARVHFDSSRTDLRSKSWDTAALRRTVAPKTVANGQGTGAAMLEKWRKKLTSEVTDGIKAARKRLKEVEKEKETFAKDKARSEKEFEDRLVELNDEEKDVENMVTSLEKVKEAADQIA